MMFSGSDTIIVLYTEIFGHWAITSALSKRHSSAVEDHSHDLSALVGHVNAWIHTSLSTGPVDGTTLSRILTFYELVSLAVSESIASRTGRIPMLVPPTEVMYLLMLSSSFSDVSRLCGILATYKRAFETSMNSTEYPKELTNSFNGYLMDACNLLWRSRALGTSDPNALGCLCPEATIHALQTYLGQFVLPLSSIFGLTYNHLSSSLAAKVLRELEDNAEADGQELAVRHSGPASQKSLGRLQDDGGLALSWKEYRVAVLQWLEQHGLDGVKALMFSTMMDLKNR